MRIIAGSAKGTVLLSPEGRLTRPTLARTRESIFNVLANIGLVDAAVVDIYSGTGAMGLEALSRGAGHAVLIDRATARLIKKNAEKCHVSDKAEILPFSAERALVSLRGKKFDYFFMDPPYDKGLINETLDLIFQNNLPADDAVIVVEHTTKEKPDLQKWIQYCSLWKEKRVGETIVTYLICHSSKDENK